MTLPAPTTFAEGQRRLYGIAAGIAGVAFGLAVIVGASIVVFGDWGPELVRLQLYGLFGCLAVGSLNTTIVIIGLLLGGPVGRFSVKASKEGAEIDASSGGSQ